MKKQLLTVCLLLVCLCGYAQTTIRGTVTSATDKQPMIGVTVFVEGTTQGTTTGINGEYTLPSVAKNAVIIFSMVGYETQKRAVTTQKTLDIVLQEATLQLDDVVVVGYGVVKKSDLTSSIITVKGDQITEMTTGNAMDALQGKAIGVQVSSGGAPGTTPRVLIRGVTTVNGSNPLYVVDGMPVGDNINFLNNDDIESMEVLKDASAAAIYGTRGSNGVILITTKKGSAGKTLFNFTTSIGVQTIANPDMASAAEYEQVFKTRYLNDGRSASWNGTNAGNTDWWNQTINSVALVQNYSFGFRGGNDKFVYSASMGYFRNESQYDYGYWDKITARLNTEYRFNKIVRAGIDLAPRVESWDDTPDLMGGIMSMDPTTPVMRPESEWVDNTFNNYSRSHNNETWNPVAQVARMNKSSREYGLLMNPYVQIEPVKGLIFRTQFGVNARFRRSDEFTPKFYIDALEKTDQSTAKREMKEWLDWNWTNTANYMHTFNKKHNLNAMVGFTAEKFSNYWLTGSRDATPSNLDDLQEVGAGTKNQQADGSTEYTTLISYLGRVMYNFDNRYYITASVRADGSSKFPSDNKYAIFPAVSAAWRVIGEPFMQNQKVFTNLKIRAGWGRVGNQNIDNGAYLSLIASANADYSTDYVFGGNRFVGSTISSVGNNTLKWETVEDYNLGVDMSFLRSRLNVTVDVFQKKSTDMLYKKQHVYASGYPDWNCQVWTNIGSMKASGWEFSINWRDQTKDFTYDIGLNLSSVKNKAIRFSGDGPVYMGVYNQDSIIRNEDGGEISRFYGYQADGLFQNWTEVYAHSDEHGNLLQPNAKPGDIRFVDRDRNGSIDEKDKTWIGNAFPDLMLGLNMRFAYKGLDLTANFYGTFGNDVFNTTKARYSGASGSNVYAGTLSKVWAGAGTSTDIPRLSANDSNLNYMRISSFFVEDGSYLRCKLLQLGYTLPKKRSDAMSVRFSFSAQNLFTVTGYSGLDPERPQLSDSVIETGIDWASYPNPRTFLFGVDLKF